MLTKKELESLDAAVKKAADIALANTGSDFPGISLKIFHVLFGWQVVSVASPLNAGNIVNDFIFYQRQFPKAKMYVAAISGNQSWSICFNWEPR
jgi:hypothetical protein